MKGTRRRKRSTQKARDKVEKREEVLHQGMAIRGINREKRKHKEEDKSTAFSVKSILGKYEVENRKKHSLTYLEKA